MLNRQKQDSTDMYMDENIENGVAYRDGEYVFGQEDGMLYLMARGRRFILTCHPYEPCLYITDEAGNKTIVHNSFDPSVVLEIFLEGGGVDSITGREYDALDFCRMVEYAAGKGDIGIDDAEKVFGDRPKKKEAKPDKDPYILKDDHLFEIIRAYPDAVPEYCLVKNDGDSAGPDAHRKALSRACLRLMAGDVETEPWAYDVAKARAKQVSVTELFSNEDIPGKLSFRKAFLFPPYGGVYTEADFARITAALFPFGTQGLEIYEWSTDWSDYFDDGHEWWGALCLTIYDSSLDRFVVILASSTD